MGFKEKLKKMSPVFRSRDIILDNINSLSSKIDSINRRIDILDEKNEYLFWLSQINKSRINDLELKKEVFMLMPKPTGDLRKIQIAEDSILKRIKAICKENDIEFFLSDGTLLGAVRHHGFIPWDDDIDISMMRDEFLKFEKAIKNDSFIELKRYYCYYSYHDSNTLLKVKYKNNESVFVDIFVFDYIECCDKNIKKIVDKYNEINNAFHKELADCLLDKGYTDFYINNNYVPKYLPDMDPVFDELFQKYYSNFSEIGNGSYICQSIDVKNTFPDYGKLLPYNHYFPLSKNNVLFEDDYYDCFKNYYDYLEVHYGDIWKLPKNLFSHHLYEIKTSEINTN